MYVGPTPELLAEGVWNWTPLLAPFRSSPEGFCSRRQHVLGECGPRAHIQTELVLAFPSPTHAVLPGFSELWPWCTFVFGPFLSSYFVLSWSTLANPRALPSLSLLPILSYCSWFTAAFLEHSYLPVMWLGLNCTYHPKFFEGGAGTPVASEYLFWFQLPFFLASRLCCWFQPPLWTPSVMEDLGRWQGHDFELESWLKSTRSVTCRLHWIVIAPKTYVYAGLFFYFNFKSISLYLGSLFFRPCSVMKNIGKHALVSIWILVTSGFAIPWMGHHTIV